MQKQDPKALELHKMRTAEIKRFCGSDRLMLVPLVIRHFFGSGANSHSLFSHITILVLGIYSEAMSATLASTVGLQSIVRN